MHVKEANAAFIRLTISENANRVGVAQVYAVGYIHSVFANEDNVDERSAFAVPATILNATLRIMG